MCKNSLYFCFSRLRKKYLMKKKTCWVEMKTVNGMQGQYNELKNHWFFSMTSSELRINWQKTMHRLVAEFAEIEKNLWHSNDFYCELQSQSEELRLKIQLTSCAIGCATRVQEMNFDAKTSYSILLYMALIQLVFFRKKKNMPRSVF